ncbi:hypothetical protein [Mesorhizobium erdmanii]|uniref:hypothetical protein n=1 Tax=Mesorhizobium erdmanii TaxID=1777866 RepID=UPI00042A022C|nr:hypothetical protein [Mesorhizobium erdmanii]
MLDEISAPPDANRQDCSPAAPIFPDGTTRAAAVRSEGGALQREGAWLTSTDSAFWTSTTLSPF